MMDLILDLLDIRLLKHCSYWPFANATKDAADLMGHYQVEVGTLAKKTCFFSQGSSSYFLLSHFYAWKNVKNPSLCNFVVKILHIQAFPVCVFGSDQFSLSLGSRIQQF